MHPRQLLGQPKSSVMLLHLRKIILGKDLWLEPTEMRGKATAAPRGGIFTIYSWVSMGSSAGEALDDDVCPALPKQLYPLSNKVHFQSA